MGVPTIVMPPTGVVGTPGPVRARADFDPLEFVRLIETKGTRVAWTRATSCPCEFGNTQTQQADPLCEMCKGTSWFYFGPEIFVNDPKLIGTLTPLQQNMVDDSKAAVIRSFMSGFNVDRDAYDRLGDWMHGHVACSVRPENRLGYYDKFVNLDATIVFNEVVKATEPGTPLTLRYPALSVNNLVTVTHRYTGEEIDLDDRGRITFSSSIPAKDTRLAVHYNCHPTWIIIDHPHAIRTTNIKRRKKSPDVAGVPIDLPIQAMAKFEFLVR